MVFIDPCKEDGKFCFIAAKRGARIGWRSPAVEIQFKRWFKHSTGSIYWEETQPETLGGKHTEETLYDLMPHGVSIPKDAFIEIARDVGMSKNRAINFLRKLIFDGRIAEDQLPRSGTNAQKIIRRSDVDPHPNAIVDKSPQKATKLVKKGGVTYSVHGEVVSSIDLTEVRAA
jgi:hypothetical protein